MINSNNMFNASRVILFSVHIYLFSTIVLLVFLCFFFFFFVFFAYGSIEYELFLKRSILLKDGTLLSTITPSQSGPGSNDNEGISHSPYLQNWSLATRCRLVSYRGHSFCSSTGALQKEWNTWRITNKCN